jgi:type IV pilus assembly protein PilW
MRRYRVQLACQAGFGLVELMIGVALGLISTIVIFQVFAAFEGRNRTTTAQVDATESGLMALLAIERDARHAGLGLIGFGRGSERQIICRSVNLYTPAAGLTTVPVMPLRIVDGGAAGSDAIELTYGSSPFAATPARLATNLATSDPAGGIVVTNTANGQMFAAGDTILIAEPATPDKPCARLRVTGQAPDIAGIRLSHATTDTLNPPAATNIFPVAPTIGYWTTSSNPALVVNVGNLVRTRYVLANGALDMIDLSSGGTETIAESIVAVQAQYGITAAATSQDITGWVNATGAWAAPAAADVARIKAIRIAVVARSSEPDRDIVTGQCTTRGGTTSNGPCAWIDDTVASPAPTIDLSVLGADWQRFRYRVYETVIPLRNVIWGDVNT